MTSRALGCALLVALATAASVAAPLEDCPAGRPFILTRALAPVTGQSPLWITMGREPVVWGGPDQAVRMVFIRELSAPGAFVISGRNRATGAKARFGPVGSTLGIREERYQLDAVGFKPKLATAKDLQRYSFHAAEVWFPQAGCYEIAGRAGRRQSMIYVQLPGQTGK